VKVSVITSLFEGGKYIENFLASIASQTIFDMCEVIIVDANSPQGEHELIGRYAAQFPQIVYLRLPYKAPIYTAWNLAIKRARGRYLTNANVDDLRRADSFELQAAALDSLPFVDVVYQDVIYSFEPLPYEQASVVGISTRLPLATPHTIMEFNCPHNAPMWRRRLHKDIGLFDDTMRSAADWDFWIRALIAGKTFYKLNDPHVVYYVNPDGASTRPDTTASDEEMKISKRLFRQAIPRASIESLADFRKRCGAVSGIDDVGGLLRYREVQSLMRSTAELWESLKPSQE
jgi:glycosyltransferase involved in cell wall biosynthesis